MSQVYLGAPAVATSLALTTDSSDNVVLINPPVIANSEPYTLNCCLDVESQGTCLTDFPIINHAVQRVPNIPPPCNSSDSTQIISNQCLHANEI